MARAYIGLGSNLDDPLQHVIQAFNELSELASTAEWHTSSLFRSAPVGPADQPDYINAVAMLETSLSPLELLHEMQAIEDRHGRMRGPVQWGPRTLDLDLLLYDELQLDTPELKLPHPEMKNRGFVLVPLYEIAPDLCIPRSGRLADLLQSVSVDGLWRLDLAPSDKI